MCDRWSLGLSLRSCHCSQDQSNFRWAAALVWTRFNTLHYYLLVLPLCILCSNFVELPGVSWVNSSLLPIPGLCLHCSPCQESSSFSFLPDLLLLVLQDSTKESLSPRRCTTSQKPFLSSSLKEPGLLIGCYRSVCPMRFEGTCRQQALELGRLC